MAFTAQQAIDSAKTRLGITGTSKDSTFLGWIDEGNAELDILCHKAGESWKETPVYVNVVANTWEYTLTNPFYHISRVFFKENDKYYPIAYDPSIVSKSYNPTDPDARDVTNWALRDEKILVIRGVPLTAVTNGLRIDTLQDTAALSLTTSIDKVRAYKLFYVIYLCRTYRQSQNHDATYVNEFDVDFARISEHIHHLLRTKHKGPKQIRSYMF